MATLTENTFESIADAAKRKANELNRRASDGIDSMKSSMETAAERVAEKAQNMVNPETVEHMREQVKETMDTVRTQANEQYEQLTDKVRKEPLTALAIAAGAGLLIGLLVRR